MSIRIADTKTGGRKKRRIPLWYHGCAFPFFLFVLVMLNIWHMFIPLLGAIFGILHFFYIKRGRDPKEFDHPLAFMRNFGLSDVGPLLRGLVVGPFVASGIFAPFRAIFLGLLWIVGWTDVELIRDMFRDLGEPGSYPDVLFGICGTVLGITVGSITWVRALRLKSQLRNLPTSTVRGAAIGLSELRGTAQPGEAQPGNGGEGDSGARGEVSGKTSPILFHSLYTESGRMRGEDIRSRFYLEDETGRILVDPQGVEFWDGKGTFLWRPIRCIYLEKRYTEEVLPYRSEAMLLPGDSVYVIGNVEENRDAPPDAADSERLVIRPASGLEEAGRLKRILFGEKQKTEGKDVFNVFFLTDVTELNTEKLFTRGLRTVWIWMLVWVALSLPLVLIYGTGG